MEREASLAAHAWDESRALRHAFFAERAAAKIADVPADTPARKVKKAAVIGAGTMGGGIAMNFANAGIPVTILEMKPEALERGLATIRKNYESTVKKGKLTCRRWKAAWRSSKARSPTRSCEMPTSSSRRYSRTWA